MLKNVLIRIKHCKIKCTFHKLTDAAGVHSGVVAITISCSSFYSTTEVAWIQFRYSAFSMI